MKGRPKRLSDEIDIDTEWRHDGRKCPESGP